MNNMIKILNCTTVVIVLGIFFIKQCESDGGVTFRNPVQFPFGGPFMGLFLAIAVPLELPNYDVFVSYNMEFNYVLPQNDTSFDYPPIISRNLPIDRRNVYEAIVYKLESHGFPGKACLLRTVCEAVQYSMKHTGVLADILHIVFTPSSSTSEGLEEYEEAEIYGKTKSHCKKYCKKCIMVLALEPQQLILFSWYDYVLFSLMLGSSVFIGIWFGFVKKQKTQNEYLHGGKRMKLLPISLSLIASSISGMTILAMPTDVYSYGIQLIMHAIAALGVGLTIHFIYAPIFYKLQVTSIYEYIDLRFNSKLRVLGSILFTLNSLIFLPILVYISALAFSYATGINVHWLSTILCGTCAFYTTIGGFKAVVWTDALQVVVMTVSSVSIFCLGLTSVNGLGEVLSKASNGGRLDFDFDLDPTKRDTFFTITFGMFFTAIGLWGIDQAHNQRYVSLPSLSDVKWAVMYFTIGTSAFSAISILTGLIIYAKYADCDPFSSGQISRKDQILPYYVLDVSKAIPGLAGLFTAGLVSASLSSLSSVLNSLSCTIYEDLVTPFMPSDTSDKAGSNILKIIVLILGIVVLLLILIIERLGNILPLHITLNGIISGPLLGIFTLGMLFPRANSKGAIIGTITSLLVMSYIIIQAQIYQSQGLLKQDSKPLSILGCAFTSNITLSSQIEEVGASFEPSFIFKISHYYYTAMGMFIMIFISFSASMLLGNNESVSKDLICPLVHWTMKDKNSDKSYQAVKTVNS